MVRPELFRAIYENIEAHACVGVYGTPSQELKDAIAGSTPSIWRRLEALDGKGFCRCGGSEWGQVNCWPSQVVPIDPRTGLGTGNS